MVAKDTISAAEIAKLSQVPPSEVDYWRARSKHMARWPIDIRAFATDRYSYGDALAVEIARQLNDDSGISSGPSVLESLRVVSYAGAVPLYFEYLSAAPHLAKALTDFWLAVSSSRNSCDESSRMESIRVTNFGPAEYWSNMHFAGSFSQVIEQVRQWMTRETTEYPDADPSRLFMANVSAADRRLRARAEEIGIRIVGNEFAVD